MFPFELLPSLKQTSVTLDSVSKKVSKFLRSGGFFSETFRLNVTLQEKLKDIPTVIDFAKY